MSAGAAVKTKFAAGKPVAAISITFAHAGLAEFLGGLGFDCVVLDAEHGALNDERLESIAAACELAGCASLLRVVTEPALVERYINLGVTGIQLPRVRSAEQVQTVVDAIKFPPVGDRGLGISRSGSYGLFGSSLPELMRAANDETVLLVQIEDRVGIGNLEEILQIDEIDAVLIGQMDLSVDLGAPGKFDDPAVAEAVEEIKRLVRAAGKPFGLAANSADDVRRAIEEGAGYLLTSVGRCLAAGATPIVQATGSS
jgi:4-hydroxy-2-oxoheptanedioate aldolase